MPQTYPIQSSFAAGEVSPKMYGRFDTPGYQQGLQTCNNAFVDSRGPVRRRPGFQHIFEKLGPVDAKLFTFDYTRDEPFLVMLTNLEVTVSASSAGGLGTNILDNASFDTDGVLTPWIDLSTGVGTVAVAGGLCTLDPGKGTDSSMISQAVLIPAVSDYKLRIAGNFTGPAGTQWEVRTGTAPGLGDHSVDLIPSDTTFFEIDYPAVALGTFYLSIYAPGWNDPPAGDTSGNIDSIAFQQIVVSQATVVLTSPYLEVEVKNVRMQMSPTGLWAIFTHPDHPPQVLLYDPVAPLWTFGVWAIISQPAEWVANSYPMTMCFHQGRSWWGGCKDDPETVWASKSGIYGDLGEVTPGTPVVSDGFNFIIAEHGRILWLESSKNLLVGTALREFIVTADSAVISGSDTLVEQQSAYGSAPIQPRQMGNETLFVSAITTKVRTLWYQWTDSGYLSRELSYTNDHITGSGVKHMTYQRDPSQFIWFVTKDGGVAGCTYHKDGNDKPVFGWHKHFIPQGIVTDISVMYEGVKVLLVFAVRVNVNGNDGIHIMVTELELTGQLSSEELTVFNVDVDSSVVFLDDYITLTLTAGQVIIPGLDHLEAKVVTPVVDGAVQTDKTVVGGQITLDYPGNVCQVGLSYTSTVMTLPQVSPAPGGGSTANFSKHRNKIYARMLDSALPKINGQRTAERHPSTPMNEGEPLSSGDVFVTNLGWDTFASVTFEQDLPYPMNIVAIFGEMAQETV